MTDPRSHIDRMMREHNDRMARAFGRRPSGQEHRAWVDHQGIRARLRDQRDLEKHLTYCGLAALPPKDPGAPPELRALLRATSAGWMFTFGLLGSVFLVAYAVGFALMRLWIGVKSIEESAGMAVIPAFIVTMISLSFLGDWVEGNFKRWFGVEPPGSRARAIEQALDALQARPFVVRVGDVLVENLPSLSQLAAWEEELSKERDEAESRERALKGLLKRMREISEGLSERPETDHTRALRDAVAAEKSLRQRADVLLGDVRARAAGLHGEIEELRQRAELDVLRSKADAALGRPRGDADIAIQTALDLDLGELGAEVDQLRAELHDERLRARALTEVGAIKSG